MARSDAWIGVDLDGTLAEYTQWQGPLHIGDPIEPMLRRVKAWIAEGKHVKIFTARMFPGDDHVHEINRLTRADEIDIFRATFWRWCDAVGLPPLELTYQKDFKMIELWDDRAKQVVPNKGLAVEDLLARQCEHNDRLETSNAELFSDVDTLSEAIYRLVGLITDGISPHDLLQRLGEAETVAYHSRSRYTLSSIESTPKELSVEKKLRERLDRLTTAARAIQEACGYEHIGDGFDDEETRGKLLLDLELAMPFKKVA